MPDKGEIIDELIDGRRRTYGDPEEVFEQHAEVFSGLLRGKLKDGVNIEPHEIALLMIAYKLVRAQVTPDYSDNIDDVIGYADIFKLVMGSELIEARSVPEYLGKVEARRRNVQYQEVGS